MKARIGDLLTYLILSGAIFLVLGLIWLFVRKMFRSDDVKRAWFSLILALAFAPMDYGGDMGRFLVPAFLLLPLGFLGDVSATILSLCAILLAWGLFFIVGSVLSFCFAQLRSKRKQKL